MRWLIALVLLLAGASAALAQSVTWPFATGSEITPNLLKSSKQLTTPTLGGTTSSLAQSKQDTFVVLDPSRLAHSKLNTFVVLIPGESTGIIPAMPMTNFR